MVRARSVRTGRWHSEFVCEFPDDRDTISCIYEVLSKCAKNAAPIRDTTSRNFSAVHISHILRTFRAIFRSVVHTSHIRTAVAVDHTGYDITRIRTCPTIFISLVVCSGKKSRTIFSSPDGRVCERIPLCYVFVERARKEKLEKSLANSETNHHAKMFELFCFFYLPLFSDGSVPSSLYSKDSTSKKPARI